MPRKALRGATIVCSVLCNRMSARSDSCSITGDSFFTRLWIARRGLGILLRETFRGNFLTASSWELESEQNRVLGLSLCGGTRQRGNPLQYSERRNYR